MPPVPEQSAGQREIRAAVARAVHAFQRGVDRERSFELIYRHYQPRMERALRRLVFSPDERRDLIQDATLRVYQGLEGLRDEASLDGWVLTILHNCYLRWLAAQPGGRKAPTMIPLETTAAGDPGVPAAIGPGRAAEPTPLDAAILRQRRERLRAAIARLTPQRRRCVELRVYQDRDVKEVALALRLAEGTVKAHLHHAREQLRQELADDFDGIDF